MVKKWITISIIFALLVVGCTLEYRFVNNSFNSLSRDLAVYKQMLEKDEEVTSTAENIMYIDSLHDRWHKKVEGLKALIWHTGLKEVESGLSRIKTYSEEDDYTEAMTELNALIDYVEHYKSDFTLSLENLL